MRISLTDSQIPEKCYMYQNSTPGNFPLASPSPLRFHSQMPPFPIKPSIQSSMNKTQLEFTADQNADRLGRYKGTCNSCHGEGQMSHFDGRTGPEHRDCSVCAKFGFVYYHTPTMRGNSDTVLDLAEATASRI